VGDMLSFHVIVQPVQPPWEVTFDEAFAALEQVPGIFLEPDGSFFRASRPGEPKWQVEGNLYDQGPRLAYFEMKGSCPSELFDELLRTLGWPGVELTFQMVQEGTQLDEPMFRQAASRER
jgi:hypothetical protein